MSDTFVRTSMLAPSAMPIAEVGIVGWIRRNLLAGPGGSPAAWKNDALPAKPKDAV